MEPGRKEDHRAAEKTVARNKSAIDAAAKQTLQSTVVAARLVSTRLREASIGTIQNVAGPGDAGEEREG